MGGYCVDTIENLGELKWRVGRGCSKDGGFC